MLLDLLFLHLVLLLLANPSLQVAPFVQDHLVPLSVLECLQLQGDLAGLFGPIYIVNLCTYIRYTLRKLYLLHVELAHIRI